MSGSGASGSSGGFEPPSNCADLAFTTQLSSPKPAVVGSLQVNESLDVATQVTNGTTVVVVLHNGQVAGGLASPNLLRLRECIEAGTLFRARVISIDSGQVRVRVEAVP